MSLAQRIVIGRWTIPSSSRYNNDCAITIQVSRRVFWTLDRKGIQSSMSAARLVPAPAKSST